MARQRTFGEYHEALRRADGSVTRAARFLRAWPSVVSVAAKRLGLRVRARGGRMRHTVCWIDEDAVLHAPEFSALWHDVGTKQLAELLEVTEAAVSQRALRLGLRKRKAGRSQRPAP